MKLYLKTFGMCLTFAAVLVPQLYANSDYYDKHIIIAIDQTPDVQTHYKMPQIKDWLLKILQNKAIPTNEVSSGNISNRSLNFNPETDCIELFAFGVEGCSRFAFDDRNKYYQVKYSYQNNLSKDDLYNKVSETLLSQKGTFRPKKDKLSHFLQSKLIPLLSAQDSKYKIINEISGLTLSYYVYPFVLNRIDTRIPAQEYYLIVITNFKSGSVDGVNSADVTRFEEWITNTEARNSINDKNDDLEDKYKKVAIAKYVPKVQESDMNLPIIVINKLIPIERVQSNVAAADIESNISISQRSLRGNKYSIAPISLRYENSDVEQVEARICVNHDLKTEQIFTYTEKDWQRKNKSFVFEGFDLQMDDLQENDTVTFSYVIFPKNTSLLPSVDIASQYHVMQKNDFVPEPERIPGWAKIIIALLVASAIVTPLYYIWRRRGRRIKAEIEDLRFVPVSRERYMDVSNMKVKEYDCWYMDPEAQKTQVKLEVKGVLRTTQRTFAKDTYRARLEFKVMDIDFDDNFTFRPIGKDNNAIPYQVSRSGEDHWYLVETNAKGEFTVPIMAYLDTEKHPELRNIDDEFWKEDHILKTQIDFRAIKVHRKDMATLTAKKLDTVLIENEIWSTHPIKIYEFIARPTFNLRDSWIAFDPGTSGACAAFITGGNIDNPDNIHVVHELVSYTGKEVYEPVYPSKIIIPDNAKAFRQLQPREEITEVRSWEEGTDQKERIDFIFGWYAARLITKNSFQSIKKLLGYTNTQSIINKDGKELQIGGKLLAQLLVKGLYAHAQRYIMDLQQNPKKFSGEIPHQPNPIDIQNQYLDNGQFSPKKAIVAVPNNYTLPKIQEMVDTVKALGQFKEVHYLYESEGILMEYCHRNWHQLDEKVNNLIMVFDMGGATINATAFKLTNITKDKHNNITDIVLKTVGKIGYCVGGDDIDYAIIRQIYNLSIIKALYVTEKDIKRHMAAHKQLLIKLARELKLAIIAKNNNQPGILNTPESFHNHILSYSKDMGWPEENVEFTEADNKTWMNPVQLCQKSKILKEFVYAKIADSVQELFASMASEYQTLPIEIIFGGRSTLFPYVTDTVIKALPQGNKPLVWDGLMKDGILDANAVKTAVASGACWYANFCQHITIEHNIITTAFGYIDHKGGKEIFVPMIQAGDNFTNGLITKETEPYSANLLQEVVFVQMQGANHEKILEDFRKSNEQKHKMNILDKVKPESDVTNIGITLDERFNFEYEITTASGVEDMTPKNYPFSRFRFGSGVKTEIADENNESYMFAAISSQEEIKEQQHVIKEASTSIKTNNNRF